MFHYIYFNFLLFFLFQIKFLNYIATFTESNIKMSQYLLSSSHTWRAEEQLSALNYSAISTYMILELKEHQDMVKIEDNSSDSNDEDEMVNNIYESNLDGKLLNSNNHRIHSDQKPYKC